MEREVREAVREVERELRGKGGRKRGWWDEECEDRKKEARKELRSKRRRGGEGKEYRRKRKEYKELCERKKKEENERWERRAMEVKKESEVWELINRQRKKRVGINEGIGLEEWKEYFMELLGGLREGWSWVGGVERKRKGRRRWI